MKALFLIGRIVFGGYFIYNGINHMVNHGMLAGYAGSKKVPKPKAAVISSGVLLLAGGTSVLLGIKPKLGAAAIIAFLSGVSPVMHNFWVSEDPNQRMADMVNFTKNLALLGAALALMGVEHWPISVLPEEPGVRDRIRHAVETLAA